MGDLGEIARGWWVAAVVVALLIVIGVVLRRWQAGRDGLVDMGPGFSPTFPLVVPTFTLSLLVLLWADGQAPSDREALGLSVVIALGLWVLAAWWRGCRSTARGVAPEEYERLRSEYQALSNAQTSYASDLFESVVESEPTPTDGPLAAERIGPYLMQTAEDIGFVGTDESGRVSGAAWNSGTGYLEIGRRFDHVRNSLIAHETVKARLSGQAIALALRLAGSNLHRDQHAALTKQLETATAQITAATTAATLSIPAASLYQIASALSSYTYTRQRELLRLRSQQHWLVMTVQLVAAVLLALAVLTVASKEAVTAAVAFSLVGSLSGMMSLLHVRSSADQAEMGEDFGLFRVELARAFTLSGMAAVMAVFVIANLPVLAASGDVFDPATDVPVVMTPSGVDIATPESTPVASAGQATIAMRAQDAPEAANGAVDDEVAWRSLGSIYGFGNVGAWLVALLAGWVPERLFRTLTDRGSRLRMDIQSVSVTGG